MYSLFILSIEIIFKISVNRPWIVATLKKVKREAAAQRCPARSEWKNCAFSAKQQAVWFETQRVSN
ncbi:MAG TPA: hypothetical protein H9857_08755 [Candidatus Desulfovibrio intestinigallinarum]|nr:hypothetical protein [Candidatus Desulfovibrio intestinigallinarum]